MDILKAGAKQYQLPAVSEKGQLQKGDIPLRIAYGYNALWVQMPVNEIYVQATTARTTSSEIH